MGATPPLSGQMPESAHPPAMGALPPQYCAAPVCRTFVFLRLQRQRGQRNWVVHVYVVYVVRRVKSVKSAKSGFHTSPFSEIKNIGLLGAKVPRFCLKSTEVSIKEVRCFRFPVPILFPREAVSVSPLLKKFFENILHFLHHKGKCIVITDDFG